jgi:hypothetical protein
LYWQISPLAITHFLSKSFRGLGSKSIASI